MAVWIRQGTGTAPTATDADLVGNYALGNSTAPPDFDGVVTSIQTQWTVTGSGFVDDSWDNVAGVAVVGGVSSTEISQHPGEGSTANKNIARSSDHTDSTGIPAGLTVADWEAAFVRGDGTLIPNEWCLWVKVKGPDGSTLAVSALTVTITYTPSAGGDVLLAGTAAGSSTAAGVLSGEVPLVGAAGGSSTAVGVLSADVPLVASAAGTSTAAGNLTVTAPGGGDVLLAGTAAGSSTAQGVLSGEVPLAGIAAGSSTADGNLTIEGTVNLTGTAAGTSTAGGVLTGDVGLTGTSAGSSTADGNLTIEQLDVLLVGSAAGSSTAVGVLTALIPLVGSAAGTSTASGVLTIPSGRERLEGHRRGMANREARRKAGPRLEGTKL